MKKYRKFLIVFPVILLLIVLVGRIDSSNRKNLMYDEAMANRSGSVRPDAEEDEDFSRRSGETAPEQKPDSEQKPDLEQKPDAEQTAPEQTSDPGEIPPSQEQERKKVALTFDDGPDTEYTPMLLDGLAKRGVKATFFVIGEQAEENPQLIKRMAQEGHLIGNHTYSHVDLKNLTDSAAKKEIKKANEVIEKYTGEEPCFLRPPFGSGRGKIEQELEMIQVLWTIDTMDWACKDEGQICSTVYREIEENSIILMHDEYPSTVRAAFRVIDDLQKKGYEFVTVDQMIWD